MKYLQQITLLLIALFWVTNGWGQYNSRNKAVTQSVYVGFQAGSSIHMGYTLRDEANLFGVDNQVRWLGNAGITLGKWFIQPDFSRRPRFSRRGSWDNTNFRVGAESGLLWQNIPLWMRYSEDESIRVGKNLAMASVPVLLKLDWTPSFARDGRVWYIGLSFGVRLNRMLGQDLVTEAQSTQYGNNRIPVHTVSRIKPLMENFVSTQASLSLAKNLGRLEAGFQVTYVGYVNSFYLVDTFYQISNADYRRVRLQSHDETLTCQVFCRFLLF